MNDMRTIGSFVLGFVVATSLAGTYAWRKGFFRANDDEPIVVAGGSLEIGSRHGFNIGPGGKNAIHSDPNRYLNRVEVLHNLPGDDAGPTFAEISPASNQPVKIVITYCSAPGVGKDCPNPNMYDTVTFDANSNHQNLSVTNQNQAFDPKSKPKRLRHGQDQWRVTQITVSGAPTPYLCDNGKCLVVLHYCKTDTACQ